MNGVKIRCADEIYNNFDPVSLRGYFLGGSLIRWLKANGGEKEAEILEETEYCDDINARIEFAFGLRNNLPKIIPAPKIIIPVPIIPVLSQYNSFQGSGSGLFGSYGSYGSFGSYYYGSGLGSGLLGYGLHII
jgi:hypothetical protein